MSPKMYFWYNYVKIWDVEKDEIFQPDFRVCQQEWFKQIEEVQASKEWGLICVKRRRVGASWLEAADVLHDCITRKLFKVGMTSKTAEDAVELFKKVKFIYDNLPDFMRPSSAAGNTQTSIDFSYFVKDANGSKKRKGKQSEILVKAPTETSWEGYALKKWVADECFGKGTKIRMFNGGVKTIEQIKIGDIVMGHDSKPRTVEATTSGISDLYRITPNKGESFVCNGAHLLTISYNGGDLMDVKTREFFNTPRSRQRYYQLARTGWELKRKALPIDPYFLGLWLGDGYSSSPSVCSGDVEVQDYLENIAPRVLNTTVTVNKTRPTLFTYYFKNSNKSSHGGLRNSLKRIKVWENKHIPIRYLNANRIDRLRLLAGIIDSDGHKQSTKDRYEVTFKNKLLAENLKDLCISLGFYTSLNKKLATMRRKDGTVYKCDVYRVGLYGTYLSEIPCIVKRKQSMGIPTKTRGRKTPERVGFKIEKIQDGEFFGVTLKENPYFLLHDGTIVHNCGKVKNLKNLFSMSNAVMMKGFRRVGTPIIFGTAGDVGKEGKDLKDMWYAADIHKLKRFFFGGWMGVDGFVDEYGNDLKEEAIRWIIYERKRRESLSTKEYNDFLQQYPLTVQEAFTSNDDQGLGNQAKINSQLTSLAENPVKAKRGYFRLDTEESVIFVPDNRGQCIIYEDPVPGVKNQYVAGSDPTDHEIEDTRNASSLSTFIMKKPSGIDPPKIVFEYTDRPNIPRDYYEQALMALIYYNNTRILIERNKAGMITYFDERGFKHLLQPSPQGLTRLISSNTFAVGLYLTKSVKKYTEELIEEYIEDYSEYIPSRELLEEFKDYGVANTDRVSALAMTLVLLREDKSKTRDTSSPKFQIATLKRTNGKLTYTR